MTTYRWKNLRFALPPSVADETVVSLVEDRDEPGYSLTLAEDELPRGASLDAYVDGAAAELKEAASVKEEGRQTRQVAGRDAVEVTQTITVPGAEARRQVQVFVPLEGGVVVLAATASPSRFDAAKSALYAVLQSLQVD